MSSKTAHGIVHMLSIVNRVDIENMTSLLLVINIFLAKEAHIYT